MKGKRFFGLAAALLMLPQLPVVTEPYGTVTVSAYTERGRCGENAYFTLDMNSGLLTIEGEGRIDDTAEYESAWNAWHRNIRNVVISDGITEIGSFAFYSCLYLESVSVGNAKITRVGDHAFEYCYNLEKLDLPDLTEIGDYAFSESRLQEFTVPEGVRQLKAGTFMNCQSLTAVHLPEGLTDLGDFCFSGCEQLRDMEIPETVSGIGENAFFGCNAWMTEHESKDDFFIIGDGILLRCFKKSAEIVLPENVRRIMPNAFTEQTVSADEYGFEQVRYIPNTTTFTLVLPDSLEEIPDHALAGMKALREIVLPETVRSIGSYAFENCASLPALTIPESVTQIGESAFRGCSKLAEITVPDSVERIGTDAFYGTALQNQCADFLILGNGLLCRYCGKARMVRVPEGVRAVCGGAFSGAGIVSIILPDSLLRLDTDAIHCTNLVDLSLGSGITEIEENAAANAQRLTEITLPPSIETISQQAFSTCGITTVTGEPGSEAEAFAQENGLTFQPSGDYDGYDLTPLDPAKDCWQFANHEDCFDETYYMLPADATAAAAFTPEARRLDGKPWTGACFGMAATVILSKCGMLPPSQIVEGAQSLSELQPDRAVQSCINYHHSLQYAADFSMQRLGETDLQMICRMIKSAARIEKGGPPLLISFTVGDYAHAVVGCGMEQGSWTIDGETYDSRILLWDPNYPQENDPDGNALYLRSDTLTLALPRYSMVYGSSTGADTGRLLTVCSDPEMLAKHAYPKRKWGDVNGDTTISEADIWLLQTYLLGEKITGLKSRNADLDTDGKLTAADLSMLRSRVIAKYAED